MYIFSYIFSFFFGNGHFHSVLHSGYSFVKFQVILNEKNVYRQTDNYFTKINVILKKHRMYVCMNVCMYVCMYV